MQRLKKKKTETGLLPDDFSAKAGLPPNDFDLKKKISNQSLGGRLLLECRPPP